MSNAEDNIIEDLILQGALEVAGIDLETGEELYNFTSKLKDVNPALHDEFSTYFSRETMALWEYGFISMNITDANPIVTLTQKALNKAEVAKLDKNHQYTLKEIIRVLLED
jgi:hypothetical protein